jgi:hypothetical protein
MPCLMVGGSADTSCADLDGRPHGQHEFNQRDLLELGEDLSRLLLAATQAGPLIQRSKIGPRRSIGLDQGPIGVTLPILSPVAASQIDSTILPIQN